MRSLFERITLKLSRKIHRSSTINLVEISSDKSEQNNASPPVQINQIVKDVMNNSVAQAMLKLFHTPYLELKILLAIFVLITISTRYNYKYVHTFRLLPPKNPFLQVILVRPGKC